MAIDLGEPAPLRAKPTSSPWLNRLVAAVGLGLALYMILPANFLTSPWVLSRDTIDYANEPGFSRGYGLDSFTSSLRTPGYPLFLALASLGELPHPDAIARAPCGTPDECREIALRSKAEVTVPTFPFVFSLSHRTSDELQHAIVLARLLFLCSLAALAWTLTDRLHPIAIAVTLAGVVAFMDLGDTRFLDVAATESLFPSLLFLYLASGLRALQTRGAGWVLAGGLIAVFAFLVRPAFIYLPAAQLLLTLFIAWRWRSWPVAVAATPILAAFVWMAATAANHFFAEASYQAALLRTAVLSDGSTVACIADPQQKKLLAAYLEAVNPETTSPATGVENYVRRYYDLGRANAYRIWRPQHAIYRNPDTAALRDNTGTLPAPLINGMIAAAGRCNLSSNIRYTLYNIAMMLGLTPVITPHAPHYFFIDSFIFPVSAILLLAGGLIACRRRDDWALFLVAAPVAIYAGTILIVAIKQGGEARYSGVVEPLFVLAVGAALSYLAQVGPGHAPPKPGR